MDGILNSNAPPASKKLRNGLFLQQLCSDKGTEFEFFDDVVEKEEEEEEEEEEYTNIPFEEVAQYINTECLGFDDEIENSNSEVLCPFEKLKSKMTKIDTDGKIMKYIKVQGVGNVVPPNAVVYIHYSAYTEFSAEPFDVTFLRNKDPVKFVLGQGGILPGLEIGISSMKKLEKAQFLIHPDLAFGKMGCPPRIPKEATILYEIELVRYSENPVSDEFKEMNMEERYEFSNVLKHVKAEHKVGLKFCEENNPRRAAGRFKIALNWLLGASLKNEEEEKEQKKLLLKIYSNLAVCFCEKDNLIPGQVCIYVKEAFRDCGSDARSHKMLYKCWGIALYHLNEFERSKNCLHKAQKLDPNDTEIQDFLKKIEAKKQQYLENEWITCQEMSGCSLNKKKE